MRHASTTCDWCESPISSHHVYYGTRHLGAYATYEGARYDFDFCDDSCFDAWRLHNRHRRGLIEDRARTFGAWSDRELADSNRVGVKDEIARRAAGLVEI